MPTPPFTSLFAVVIEGKDTKVYARLATARTQVTKAAHLGKHAVEAEAIFTAQVQLWEVGASGWTLLFQASPGMTVSCIPWRADTLSEQAIEPLYALPQENLLTSE